MVTATVTIHTQSQHSNRHYQYEVITSTRVSTRVHPLRVRSVQEYHISTSTYSLTIRCLRVEHCCSRGISEAASSSCCCSASASASIWSTSMVSMPSAAARATLRAEPAAALERPACTINAEQRRDREPAMRCHERGEQTHLPHQRPASGRRWLPLLPPLLLGPQPSAACSAA